MIKQACWIMGLVMCNLCARAQQGGSPQAEYPRDTSYTLRSVYEKLHKKYSFIKPVSPHTPRGVAGSEGVVYRRLGNRALQLDLYYPASAAGQKYPGVVLVHGGGWRTGDRSLAKPMAQQLAAQGYVTAAISYRLSPEAAYPAAVHDVKAAVRWLRAQAVNLPLDTTKIAIYGTSAGGQLAALTGTTNGMAVLEGGGAFMEHSSAVQAIIDVDGVLAFKHPESEEGSMAAQWLGGSWEQAPAQWRQASALTHVGENTPPLLFIGSAFPRFHAGKSDMLKVLQKHGIYYETYLIPDSPHSFWLFEPWFEPTFQYTLNFLDRVFKQEQQKGAGHQ